MGRLRNRLTARFVATVREPGRHADGGNLYLNVTSSGGRSWVLLYKFNGRQREMGLGSAFDVSLAVAREKADWGRAEINAGRDPLAGKVKAKARTKTFADVADELIEAMRPTWRNEKHAAQWSTTLGTYAALLRPMPVADVETADVLAVLKPIWAIKPETASRLRGRIEAVLDAAKASGLHTGENPARWRGHLEMLLPKRTVLSRGHQAALPYQDVPAFVARLRGLQTMSALALEFTILTAARSGEALGAVWGEIDLAERVWTIPATRMKSAKEHRVPLAARAVELLTGMPRADPGGFVFPSSRPGRPLSDMTLTMLLRRLEVPVTTHGFRSSFRDWVSETTDFPHEAAEMALAHTIPNSVERAYRRGDLFEKRRAMMLAWDGFCQGGGNE